MKTAGKEGAMGRRRKTIQRIYTQHQAAIVMAILAVFLAGSIFIYAASRRNAVRERSFQVENTVSTASAKLNLVDSAVLDVSTMINENYDGLFSVENGRKVIDKMKLNRLIQNKQTAIPDICAFYAFRPGDFMVFQGTGITDINERLRIKDYLEYAGAPKDPDRQRMWQILRIEGQDYIWEQVYLLSSDIHVGAMLRPEKAFEDLFQLAGMYEGELAVRDLSGLEIRSGALLGEKKLGIVKPDEIAITPSLKLSSRFILSNQTLLQDSLIPLIIGTLVFAVVLILLNNRSLKKELIRPVRQLSAELEQIEDVRELQSVPVDAEVYELRQLQESLNTLLEEVVYDRMQLYETELHKKEQELALLYSQIRPHFFLNAITTVNAMTYQNRNEDIRSYLQMLSQYIRYVIGIDETVVMLDQELKNITNYFELQEIRYPQKAMVFIDAEEETKTVRVPKFLLLTVVENTFKYVMGRTEFMEVLIQCTRVREEGFYGVLIVIEDNGPGFGEEQLAYYNSDVPIHEESSEHVGLTNVKQTLYLHYDRNDLMRISNGLPSGARIELRIPLKEEQEEST